MVRVTEALIRKKSEHNECLISTLEEISLHQEDIERIEHFHNWCRDLKILLLQSNLIAKIENLFKLKKLEYLNLAVNNIERIENLEKLESLNKLDLTLNFVGELTSIESLRANYNLRELILTGNPCCDYPNYRKYVIATLPQLQSLDSEEIKMTHRLQAQKNLKQYRNVIVQKQVEYALQRDEQKIRVLQKQKELEEKMANIEDEDERIKTFWDSKSEHCPEIRNDIAKYHNMNSNKNMNSSENVNKVDRKTPALFAPCGRPYNLNQPKLPFNFQDEAAEYVLELSIYKYLDTSQLKVDIETNFVRVNVKKKIFQIALTEEVEVSKATVQRSQITGQLVIRIPKLHINGTLTFKAKQGTTEKDKNDFKTKRSNGKTLTGIVNIRNICEGADSDMPDLI